MIKIILSICSAIAGLAVSAIFKLLYSPISGYVTAQQFNDTSETYTLAKFVRDGYFDNCVILGVILLLVLIWTPYDLLFKSKKSCCCNKD